MRLRAGSDRVCGTRRYSHRCRPVRTPQAAQFVGRPVDNNGLIMISKSETMRSMPRVRDLIYLAP